jgi:hypothetical protein
MPGLADVSYDQEFGVHLPSSGQVSEPWGTVKPPKRRSMTCARAPQALIAEVGIPAELTLTLNVA